LVRNRASTARRPARTAWLPFALAAVLAGCGTSGTLQGGNDAFTATTLTVYSDLPTLGPDGAQMTAIVNGEALALYDHAGHVGRLHVSLASLNDAAEPLVAAHPPLATDESQTGQSAHTASSDLSTGAYIGDYSSAATAISLPLNNENDILQISPGSPYIGLTDANPVNAVGYPGRNYPYGARTFARLVPSDLAEARATVSYMRSQGVRTLYLLADSDASESNLQVGFDSAIAQLVAQDASAAGITLVGRRSGIDTLAGTRPGAYASVATAVAAAHPDAVLLGGVPNAGAQALWSELHSRLPRAKLFAPSTLATPSFLRALAGAGGAAHATFVTSPILEPGQYPASAQRVFAEYRRLIGAVAPTPYVLYGYEAMSDVLTAIQRAGGYAAHRPSLAKAFFSLGEIHGVIGNYTINANGDTSLQSFDGYRVDAAGALVLVRRIS
jgi:branched-chain amino acid transport system substrate-binding protein